MSRVLWTAVLFLLVAFTCQSFLSHARAEEQEPQVTGNAVDIVKRGDVKQVVIEARLFELNRTKMRRLGFDIATKHGKTATPLEIAHNIFTPGDEGQPPSAESVSNFLDALCRNGVARILAEPTLTTVDNHTASLVVGSSIERSVPESDNRVTIFLGTKFDVTPRIGTNDRVSLDLRISWRGLDESENTVQDAAPKVHVGEIETGIETHSGETVVIAGLTQQVSVGDETEEKTLFLMVTSTIVDGKNAGKWPTDRLGQAKTQVVPSSRR